MLNVLLLLVVLWESKKTSEVDAHFQLESCDHCTCCKKLLALPFARLDGCLMSVRL